MKILRAKLPAVEITVPVRGGFRVRFQDHQATMPDEVADTLVALGGGFYSYAGQSTVELTSGSRVLVIRDMGLGDVLLITPLLRHLAALGVQVDVQTLSRYQCLFDGNPSVRRTFSLEEDAPSFESYDCLLDLRLFVENEEITGHHRHRIDGFASAADVVISEEASARKLDYFVTLAELTKARKRTAKLMSVARLKSVASPRGMVGYVWRASAANRTWSDAQHLMILDALNTAGWNVVVLDHETQHGCPNGKGALDLTGLLSIRETAAIMACCDVILTPDTGLFHLAGALDLPTVAYFGAFPAAERQAHQTLTVLNTPENCGLLPCRSYRCLNREADGQSRCLTLIPGDVIKAIEAVSISAASISAASISAASISREIAEGK